MQAIEIGVAGGPIEIAVTGREGLLQGLEGLRFPGENAIGARSVV